MTRARTAGNGLKMFAPWDMIVIGGGATGLGTAVEAASRGYPAPLLLSKAILPRGLPAVAPSSSMAASGTCSRGMCPWLHQALRERGLLLANAPHLVHGLSFVVPLYDWWEGPFYGVGLKLYDTLAGSRGLGSASFLSREQTLAQLPDHQA